MRVYILEHDTVKQVLMLPPEEIVFQLIAGQRVLFYLVEPYTRTDVSKRVVMTIPEIVMWINHEAALMKYLDIHLDRIKVLVHTPLSPYRRLMGDYRKLAQTQAKVKALFGESTVSLNPVTNPISSASMSLLMSHRASWVAEAPSKRLQFYPKLTDLSKPYMTDLKG